MLGNYQRVTEKKHRYGFERRYMFQSIIFRILREPQHTLGAYPMNPLSPPNERNPFINSWLGVSGMFQG